MAAMRMVPNKAIHLQSCNFGVPLVCSSILVSPCVTEGNPAPPRIQVMAATQIKVSSGQNFFPQKQNSDPGTITKSEPDPAAILKHFTFKDNYTDCF